MIESVVSRRLAPLLLLAALGACRAPAPQPEVAAAPEPASVRLIAINDFHGHLLPVASLNLPDGAGGTVRVPAGGAAYMAELIDTRRAEHPASLVVAAGDLIGASLPVSSLFHEEPTIDVLDRIGLDVSSLGNHEFDRGETGIRRIIGGGCAMTGERGVDTCVDGDYRGAQFEYLAANVVDARTGRHAFTPATIREVRDEHGRQVRIGFIGALLQGTRTLVDPAGIAGLRFVDEAAAVNQVVPKLQAEGVDAIVLLIHEGARTAGDFDDASCPGLSGPILDIMDRLDPAVRVVISGHTHWAYVCERDGRLLTSGGSYGRFVTTIDLRVDAQADAVVGFAARNEPVINDLAPNPLAERWPTVLADREIGERVAVWSARAQPITDRPIGRISGDLTRSEAGEWETRMGNVIADAQLAATAGPASGAADFALMNPGGVRSALRVAAGGAEGDGVVTWGELYATQPFGNTLMIVPMTGAAIVELLESQFYGDYPNILSPSANLSFALDPDAPRGARVVPDSLRLDGEPLEPARVYRVTLNSFIVGGGDGYVIEPAGEVRSGPADIDALVAYFEANSPLAPPPLERVRRVD